MAILSGTAVSFFSVDVSSDFSVLTDEGDSVVSFEEPPCGPGVSSREPLDRSTWKSRSLSSSSLSNMSASAASVVISVPSPSRMMRPPPPGKSIHVKSYARLLRTHHPCHDFLGSDLQGPYRCHQDYHQFGDALPARGIRLGLCIRDALFAAF